MNPAHLEHTILCQLGGRQTDQFDYYENDNSGDTNDVVHEHRNGQMRP